MTARNPLAAMFRLGQSPWLDFLERKLIVSDELADLIALYSVRGVTSNPAIFNKAIADSNDYESQIAELAVAGRSADQIYESLVLEDVVAAADILRGIYEESGGRDGFVSLEVSPHLVHDTIGTIAEARRFWGKLARPNVMIKIPGTTAGLAAIRELIAVGINVNVTLLFSLDIYRHVIEAYLLGLEDALAARRPLNTIASVASFFVSRIDSMVDPLLEAIEARQSGFDTSGLQGEIAIACARRAYVIFRNTVHTPRFRNLAEAGAQPQRLLWASTGTKNPAYSDIKYIEPLIGPNTVSTMPPATLRAYRDHGQPAARLAERADEAAATLSALQRTGIGLNAVADRLLEDGIRKFVESFDSLLQTLEQKCT